MREQMLGQERHGKHRDPDAFALDKRASRRYARHVQAQAFAAYVRAVTS
ncbi:hypothetical protein [Tsukamurella tyrosinosolvens]|nr:hypothetical protein [Tsukamurella tyrosinosolvens]MEC4616318.1 hypothetical protein [Tsukamurella tyrosinosolvens]